MPKTFRSIAAPHRDKHGLYRTVFAIGDNAFAIISDGDVEIEALANVKDADKLADWTPPGWTTGQPLPIRHERVFI